MSAVTHPLPRAAVDAKLTALMSTGAVALAVFLSGFVHQEPAPYELVMAALIPIWAVFGLRLSRTIAPLIVLLVLFNIGGWISMLQMSEIGDTPHYLAITLFLSITGIFFAAVLEERPDLYRPIVLAWLAAAVLTALLGILGYFNAFPGSDVFTKYERAAGAFKDPNVFGPFLTLPGIWLVHRILTGPVKRMPLYAAPLLVIALGLFLSFSRGAWGLFLFCALLLVFALLIQHRSGFFRVRILIMGVIATVALAIALIVALQIPAIADLFVARAQLVQEYDGARLGRFARHWIGFAMAMEHPFGIGPLVFGRLYGEDTHNIWLKALLDYSWLGFGAYFLLIVWTLAAGLRILFRDRPWQPILLCAYIVLLGHVLLGAVIDTNHWRHFYLLLGMIWGALALERHHQSERKGGAADGTAIEATAR